MIDRHLHKYPFSSSEKYGFTTGITTGEKDHNNTADLDKVVYLPFERLSCPVPACYDSMLTNQYGDYMELPPEGQRHVHPSTAIWRTERNEKE